MTIYDHLHELSEEEVRQLLIKLIELRRRTQNNIKKVTAELYRRQGGSEEAWGP